MQSGILCGNMLSYLPGSCLHCGCFLVSSGTTFLTKIMLFHDHLSLTSVVFCCRIAHVDHILVRIHFWGNDSMKL